MRDELQGASVALAPPPASDPDADALLPRRLAIGLATFGLVSLLAGFAAAIFFTEPDVISAGNDGFSSSALGHRALVELLERAGHEVVLSRGRSAEKARAGALLVVLEPGADFELDEDGRTQLAELVEGSARVLVALPKWRGFDDLEQPGWLGAVELLPPSQPAEVLAVCGVEAKVTRVEAGNARFGASSFRAAPELDRAQLVEWGALEPWIAADEGVLLGRVAREDGRELWVLSDPDLLANHGLAHSSNAALALELAARLAPPGRALVIDETLHGFTVVERVWAELGRFPLVLTVLQALLAIALLTWSGMRRFGAPLPAASRLGAGKLVLVRNTADLLLHAGRSRAVLTRYFAQERRRVARAFHLARGGAREERRRELERIERAKAPSVTLAEVEEAVQRATDARRGGVQRTLRAARLVRTWSEEMLHGAR